VRKWKNNYYEEETRLVFLSSDGHFILTVKQNMFHAAFQLKMYMKDLIVY